MYRFDLFVRGAALKFSPREQFFETVYLSMPAPACALVRGGCAGIDIMQGTPLRAPITDREALPLQGASLRPLQPPARDHSLALRLARVPLLRSVAC